MKLIISLIIFFSIYAAGTVIAQQKTVPPASGDKILFGKNLNLEQLSSKLIDEYGLENIKFLKTQNGNYIPLKSGDLKKFGEDLYLDTNTIIIVLAIIGAIALILFIFR